MKKNTYNLQATLKMLSFCVASLIGNSLSAQNVSYEWAKNYGGTGYAGAMAVTTDASLNVYSTGQFSGTIDFDPSAAVSNLTSNTGGSDVFISKMDPAGNLVWVKQFGGTSNDKALGIQIDALGNIYTTGYFEGTVDFDPGTGTSNLTSNGSRDIFISKLDASGNFVWAKNMGGTGWDDPFALELDGSGNPHVTGRFEGTADFNPAAATANLTSNGARDIFVTKLDAAGNYVWAKSFGGTGTDEAYAMNIDAAGYVYTTGRFEATMDADPGAGVTTLTTNGGRDVFVSKLDANGNFAWTKNFGGWAHDQGHGIAADASGNVYVTGNFGGTVDFDPGTGTSNLTAAGLSGAYITKLDVSGNFVWAQQFAGPEIEQGMALCLDDLGNVYTTGRFYGTVDFDPGAGTTMLTSNGQEDTYITKLDATGNLIWVNAYGSTSSDFIEAFHIDASRNVYTGGAFYNTVDFDPGTGVDNFTTTGGDAYILKLSCGPTYGRLTVEACVRYVFNGTTYTSSNNTATDTLVNSAGCDSIVNLDLTITTLDVSTTVSGNTITANNTATGTTYQWIICKDNSPIAGETNASYTATANGVYAVIVTYKDCVDTSECVEIKTASIWDRNKVRNAYPLFPNPTTSKVTISNYKSSIEQVTILDITGKTLQSFAPKSAVIDMSILPKGIYLITLKDGENTSTQKVIKH